MRRDFVTFHFENNKIDNAVRRCLRNKTKPFYCEIVLDRLIRHYGKQKADVSGLRPYILKEQQFHRIYYYVNLNRIKNVEQRMAFIHENLLFSDWWHTDQIISYVADLDFDTALSYAKVTLPSFCP